MNVKRTTTLVNYIHKPLVSIIIHLVDDCNNNHTLESCIKKIQQQSYQSIELIIIDNSLKKNLLAIATSYALKYNNIRYYSVLDCTNNHNIISNNILGEYFITIGIKDDFNLFFIENLINKALECNSDLVYSDIIFHNSMVFDKDETIELSVKQILLHTNTNKAKLYRTSLIQNCGFIYEAYKNKSLSLFLSCIARDKNICYVECLSYSISEALDIVNNNEILRSYEILCRNKNNIDIHNNLKIIYCILVSILYANENNKDYSIMAEILHFINKKDNYILFTQYKVSIIIPVYNNAKYLKKCLDSVITQQHKNIEIIIIDDASQDQSLDIIIEYAKIDNRIKYFVNKHNSGVAKSRNIGLQESSGAYVAFIDGDDWVSKYYIINMLVTMVIKDVDLVCCGFIKYLESENTFLADTYSTFEGLNIFYKVLSLDEYLLHWASINPAVLAKLFNLSKIKKYNIFFNPLLVLGEDLEFLVYYKLYIKNFSSILMKGNFYYYRKSSNNLSISTNCKNYYTIFDTLDSVENILRQRNLLAYYYSEFAKYKILQIQYWYSVLPKSIKKIKYAIRLKKEFQKYNLNSLQLGCMEPIIKKLNHKLGRRFYILRELLSLTAYILREQVRWWFKR